ncbi:MAG: hypothetical protein ACRC6B_12485 [Fusobacteriaceae bacterium]
MYYRIIENKFAGFYDNSSHILKNFTSNTNNHFVPIEQDLVDYLLETESKGIGMIYADATGIRIVPFDDSTKNMLNREYNGVNWVDVSTEEDIIRNMQFHYNRELSIAMKIMAEVECGILDESNLNATKEYIKKIKPKTNTTLISWPNRPAIFNQYD